jgi:type II secretory pathway pseudopilin PulG
MKRPILQRLRRAFLLVEVMLAVAIFAVAVLALAKSVEAMLNAQIIKDEDEKVRRFMESKMMEIEAGAVPLQDSMTEEIKGWLPDMRLKTTRTPLKRKNEKGVELTGLYMVTLDLVWLSGNEKMERSLSFYIYPRQR